MIYVFLADGTEEIEALTSVDFLRRADLDVKIVKVGENNVNNVNNNKIEGSRQIGITADIHETDIDLSELADLNTNLTLEMIVLPGGGIGVENLYKSDIVKSVIEFCVKNNIKIGAICAAPSILARLKYLKGVKSTAFPTFRHYLTENGAVLEETKNVVTDGIFTTADGVRSSIDFALELVKILKGEDTANKIGR